MESADGMDVMTSPAETKRRQGFANRRCRRCFRLAREGRIYCEVHLKELSPHALSSTQDLLGALEELTEAARELLWDWESRTRRKVRRVAVNGRSANRLRNAARRAQDVLVPTENRDPVTGELDRRYRE